ncbi:hypothetical protein IKF94_01055 [Candidatus Saccharibacteria bacterium]|nr:hypothetical protein [Candidatus Saccharibacteria bacterium]
MAKERTIGLFPHYPQDESDMPLSMFPDDIPDSFLDEEIAFGATIGDSCHLSDISNMWRDVTFAKALMKHPEAIIPLKELANRFGIEIQPVTLKDYFHVLSVTDQYLWENNVDTVEDLFCKFYKKTVSPPEVVRNDLDSAFMSIYGISLTA